MQRERRFRYSVKVQFLQGLGQYDTLQTTLELVLMRPIAAGKML